ncbi:MAG: hypothetical protein LBV69_05455 [Bacteroidales bacterium]|nr:hypothetical protein [Bacteroidales bacterium]
MKKYFLFVIFFLFVLFIESCERPKIVSTTPTITFTKFSLKDTVDFNHLLRGTLKFEFVDGDGNIGFGTDSTANKTVFLEKYKIINSIPNRIEFNEGYLLNYRIPVFSTTGNRKVLSGEIVLRYLDETFPINPNDTIMYKFYIYDRDMNKSNIDSTGYIILKNYL